MDFLEKVERQLDLPPAEKQQVMRELKSHYEDLKEELICSGMQVPDAETEALKRLGEPADIAAHMSAVHNTASWKSAILAATPMLASILVILLWWTFIPFSLIKPLIFIISTVFVFGTLREFIRSRRPIWMTSWLAISLALVIGIIPPLIVKPWEAIPSQGAYASYILLTVSGVIWSVLALTSCWKSPKLRLWSIAAVCATLFLVIAIKPLLVGDGAGQAQISMTRGVLGKLLYLTVIIGFIFIPFLTKLLVGLGVFTRHAYGTAAHASLFLFVLYALPGISFFYKSSSIDFTAFHLLGWMVFALTIIAFTRTSSTRKKLSVLVGGMLIGGLIISFSRAFLIASTMEPTANTAPFILSNVITQLLPYILVAVSPLLWDLNRQRRQRMETAA